MRSAAPLLLSARLLLSAALLLGAASAQADGGFAAAHRWAQRSAPPEPLSRQAAVDEELERLVVRGELPFEAWTMRPSDRGELAAWLMMGAPQRHREPGPARARLGDVLRWETQRWLSARPLARREHERSGALLHFGSPETSLHLLPYLRLMPQLIDGETAEWTSASRLGFRAHLAWGHHLSIATGLFAAEVDEARSFADPLVAGTDLILHEEEATLSAQWGPLRLRAGRDRHRWGPGVSGTLLLSDAGAPLNFVEYRLRLADDLSFVALTGETSRNAGRTAGRAGLAHCSTGAIASQAGESHGGGASDATAGARVGSAGECIGRADEGVGSAGECIGRAGGRAAIAAHAPGDPPPRNPHPHRYLSAHRLLWNVTPDLYVAFSEGARYQSASPHGLYLVGIVPYTLVERLDLQDAPSDDADELLRNNVLWSLDFAWRFAEAAILYGEILADDIATESSEMPTRGGFQLGATWAPRWRGWAWTLGAEFTKVSNYTYSVYYQELCACDWEHQGLPLGYAWGPDVENSLLRAVVDPHPHWSLGSWLRHAREGEGALGRPWRPAASGCCPACDPDCGAVDAWALSGSVRRTLAVGVELRYRPRGIFWIGGAAELREVARTAADGTRHRTHGSLVRLMLSLGGS
ncbi:MAG: hypothetical protein GF330_06250 [Candidatus Eisenbacteria bacterium]|nr:hypothetical protein [Candidatus Eisenbacteria bacterium]